MRQLGGWWIVASVLLIAGGWTFRGAAQETETGEGTRAWSDFYRQDSDLYDVEFVNRSTGWAVGDRGTILQTTDGGATWQLQTAPVSCRLDAVTFVDAQRGWAVGGYSVPYTHRSAGVILRTQDGGRTWTQTEATFLPWLHEVHFVDAQTGYVLGDASQMFPSALFQTRDGGEHWTPLPGNSRGWIHGVFDDRGDGLLLDTQGQFHQLTGGRMAADPNRVSDPRMPIRVGAGSTNRRLVCGNQGLILKSTDGGLSWSPPSSLPTQARVSEFDWLAIENVGDHWWIAGVPGTRVLASNDNGQTWVARDTGQTMPLFALSFRDETNGVAVGAYGTVLQTSDGGQHWTVVRAAGRRLGMLGVFAQIDQIPWDLYAQIGSAEGYYSSLEVLSAEPTITDLTATPIWRRLHEAMDLLGAGGANIIPVLPATSPELRLDAARVQSVWNQSISADSLEQLSEYLTRQIRMWRPEMVVFADPTEGHSGANTLVQQIVLRAVQASAGTTDYPDQLKFGRLAPWQVPQVGTISHRDATAGYRITRSRLSLTRGERVSALATRAESLVLPAPAPERTDSCVRIASYASAQSGHDSRSVLFPAATGPRAQEIARSASTIVRQLPSQQRLAQQRHYIESMLRASSDQVASRLGQIGQLASQLPPADRAEVLFVAASRAQQLGESETAAELLSQLLTTDEPGSLDEAIWLARLRLAASHEAALHWPLPVENRAQMLVAELPIPTAAEGQRDDWVLNDSPEKSSVQPISATIRDNESRLELVGRLASQIQSKHPQLYFSPAVRTLIAATLRERGATTEAAGHWRSLVQGPASLRWADCATDELALLNSGHPTTKPRYVSTAVTEPPHLDGELSDAIWAEVPALELQPNDEMTPPIRSTIQVAHDREFVYVAAKCQKSPERPYSTDSRTRQRDTDLSEFDRVEWIFDVDRDYATAWKFSVDRRGWASESLNDDLTWDPEYYVAAADDEQFWLLEIAIPIRALTSHESLSGRSWSFAVRRVIPGSGLYHWSHTDLDPSDPNRVGLLEWN